MPKSIDQLPFQAYDGNPEPMALHPSKEVDDERQQVLDESPAQNVEAHPLRAPRVLDEKLTKSLRELSAEQGKPFLNFQNLDGVDSIDSWILSGENSGVTFVAISFERDHKNHKAWVEVATGFKGGGNECHMFDKMLSHTSSAAASQNLDASSILNGQSLLPTHAQELDRKSWVEVATIFKGGGTYLGRFEELQAVVMERPSELPESSYVFSFMRRLIEILRATVTIHKPKALLQALEIAGKMPFTCQDNKMAN